MSENRFLNFVLTEGIISIVLGILVIVLPKISNYISFGLMLSISLIIYGGYRAITAFLARNFDRLYVLKIVNSLILFVVGMILYIAPIIDMTIIATVFGVYFISQSIFTNAFTLQTTQIFNMAKTGYCLAYLQLFFGIIFILLLPALWTGGVIFALNLIISGYLSLKMYMTKKYV